VTIKSRTNNLATYKTKKKATLPTVAQPKSVWKAVKRDINNVYCMNLHFSPNKISQKNITLNIYHTEYISEHLTYSWTKI